MKEYRTVEVQTDICQGVCEEMASPTKSLISETRSNREFIEESDFSPGIDSEEETESENDASIPPLPTSGRKILVCEEKLDQLFSCCVCQECQGPVISTSKTLMGSMIAAQLSCLNGHTQSWQLQPYIRGTPEGNVLLAASILLSGNTYEHVNGIAKLLRLSFIGKSAFYT